MSQLTPWLVVLVYIVPLLGALVSLKRRVGSLWSMGDSLRRLFPEDRVYRRIRVWEGRYQTWKDHHPIASYLNVGRLDLVAGTVEYAFGHLRDYTIGLFMTAAFVVDLALMIFLSGGDQVVRFYRFPSLCYHGFFALLSLWTYRRHVATGLKMTEFMRVNPHVHPGEFFEHYYRHLGPAESPIPIKAARTVDPLNVSYLTGKGPRQVYWPLIHGAYDTAIFARSAYKALETLGEGYGREVFDVMAGLWGSRMLQLFHAKLVVEGVEKLNALSGKIILVFNHKGNFDFVLNFFALSATSLASGRKIRPRYMAAKDHFVDNKFVYNGIGVGKLIENVDMVFVDRKGKGKQAILDACRKLAEKDIEIAMYPQGTRALANTGPQGERLDAGYYTTGTVNSLKKDHGHLKKGCAYLALDTAMILRERAEALPVHLVFIGIDGTATLMPKGTFAIQTEGTAKFTVGDVFTLSPEAVAGLERPAEEGPQNEGQRKYLRKVDELQAAIDRGLVKALGLHEKLRARFLEEIRGQNLLPREHYFMVSHRLSESLREGAALPFIILDRIYALPFEERRPFLKEAAGQFSKEEDLLSLRDQVTDQLFRHRGKELNSIIRQEKARKVS